MKTDKAFQETRKKPSSWLEGPLRAFANGTAARVMESGLQAEQACGFGEKLGRFPPTEGRANLKLFRSGYDRFMEKSAATISHEMLAGLGSPRPGFRRVLRAGYARGGAVVLSGHALPGGEARSGENASVRGRIRESIRHFSGRRVFRIPIPYKSS